MYPGAGPPFQISKYATVDNINCEMQAITRSETCSWSVRVTVRWSRQPVAVLLGTAVHGRR